MPDLEQLNDFSVEELLAELKQRQAIASPPTMRATSEGSTGLRAFESEAIAQVVQQRQRVVYGGDSRKDWFQLNGAQKDDADCVVALIFLSNLKENDDGTTTIQVENFGQAQNLCAREPFRDQPVGAFCSGFLVAPDIIATAGHCVNMDDVKTIGFVFGFRMNDATTAQITLPTSEVYRGVSVIDRKQTATGPDWALVKLDRPVTGHKIVSVRREGKVPDQQAVHVIGHPSGLPLKYADGAHVRTNGSPAHFIANLDTYGGNSGSPVFNSDTHQVEGILVRGENDFVSVGDCQVSMVCPDTGCRGEDCTRTTEFTHLL
ncbi:MAG: serine protease [Oculatellaceae cyanobacterium Prado106]|nr:serine protease [Oculatellaceae cyanobacterium Prado106]